MAGRHTDEPAQPVSVQVARCASCKEILTIEVVVDLGPVTMRLDRIEQALTQEGVIMSEVDDKLTALQTSLGDLATDLDRELADLKNALSGSLTADQEAAFQAVSDRVAAMKTAIDTADPAPAGPSDGAAETPPAE